MSRESQTASNTVVNRRRRFVLPKRRWHILGAILVLAFFTGALARVALSPVLDKDPNVTGEIALDAIPQPLPSTHLEAESDALPDLLAGDVPQGENPTAAAARSKSNGNDPKVDALGNPIKTSSSSQVSRTPSGQAAAPKPKTILIDGKALDGGSATLFPKLTRQGRFGPLPTVAPDGQTALKAYRRVTRLQSGKQPVSLIIGGLGVNQQLTQQAIDGLPADVTLSFAAHSVGLQDWINRARADGHEVLIEIPMNSAGFNPNEPGADRTLKAGQEATNQRHLDWLLSRAQGYFGVTNYNGDLFLNRADASLTTLDRLSKSGLGFITDGAFSTASLNALTQSVGLPYKQGFGLIDPEPNPALIEIELSRLAAQATSGSAPAGIGFAYPETLDAVTMWIASLPSQSLQLVPASSGLK
jgi:polysaccharide deacetylase 2 family uncharacterized protein YibQ